MDPDPHPPSPEITTKQILGASSSGWSPQRQVNRKFVPLSSHTPQNTQADTGLPRKSMAVLKHHSLVSNSVFLQRAPASVSSTAFTPSPPSPSKHNLGVGLGIGVKSPPGKNTITPRLGPAFTPRKLSGERVGSGSHAPDAENQAPSPPDVFGSRLGPSSAAINARKSKGIDALAKASYVSNSPFKQHSGSPGGENRPLQPRNAWSVTAEVKASINNNKSSSSSSSSATGGTSPTRPLSFAAPGPGITSHGRMYRSPDMFDDHPATPRAAKPVQSAPAQVEPTRDSPASRGWLTSNRLHGPRQMSTGALEDDLRSERRKTVTFDEVLEVQEFDKESSFDRESTRSASSGVSQGMDTPISESEQWIQQGPHQHHLHVVNGHPDHSPTSSEDLPALMPSTGSTSSDASTFEETPEIPQLQDPVVYNGQALHHSSSLASIPSQYSEEASYEPGHGYVRGKSPGAGDESFNSLTGLHRVDSLVDELLSGEILNNSPALDQETPRRRSRRVNNTMATHQAEGFAAHHEEQATRALPLPPDATSNQLGPGALPSLPNWSPLVVGEGEGPELENTAVSDPAQPSEALSRPPGGRPRITRDAVLERVRAAKQEESSPRSSAAAGRSSDEAGQPDVMSASHTHTAALIDADTAGSYRPELMSRTSSMPAQAQDSTPRRPVPKSAPSYEARAAPAPSPIRHDVVHESPLDRLSAEVVAEQGDIRRQSHDEGRRSSHLAAPQMPSRPDSSSSGRASPSSMLTEPPPPVTPGEQADRIIARRRSKNGGSMRKRSLSAGDAAQLSRHARDDRATADGGGEDVGEDSFFERHRLTAEEEEEARDSIGADLAISKAMLDQSLKSGLNIPFTRGMEREINRIYKDTDARYNTIDRGVIKGVDDKVQTTSAGDIDSGKAWRKLRRPSDMNEYAQELREIQSNNAGTKPLGKIFVLVDSFIPVELPVPSKATRFYCVLDNGLHMVKTGLANLRSDRNPSAIGQEFELIQHKNLEFSFTLVAVRDPHLQEPSRLPQAPASPKKTKSSPSLAKGVSRLFGSPKKQSSKLPSGDGSLMESSAYARPQTEPMLAYMNREGAFGRTRVLFEELQERCLGTCAIFDCAVMGVAEPVGSVSAASRLATLSTTQSAAFEQNLSKVRGKLRLKIFYLPPIPSIPRNLLPDSLAECVQGMRAATNQKVHVWMQGTLTQMGGDCRSWRRRPVQAQGMSLICFNEITRRPIVKIDLSKAVQLEDNFDPVDPALVSPSSKMATTPSRSGAPAMQRNASTISTTPYEDLDENYHVERSFRITFADGERISFFTDTDEEKERWLDALGEVVGKPSLTAPIWAHAATEVIRGLTGQEG